MHALTEVNGNVYFCDFETAQREHAREYARGVTARAEHTDRVVANTRLMVAQINALSREIAAAHTEITRQAREQSGDLLSLADAIKGIVLQAGISRREGFHPDVNETYELAQNARAAAAELLALAREQVLQGKNAARRVAEIGQRNGLTEHIVA